MRGKRMDANMKTWELPFGVKPKLDFSAGAAAVVVMPVASGEKPRLEVKGALSTSVNVDVETRGEDVVVRLRMGEGFPFWNWGPNSRVTLYVPHELQGMIRSDAGRIKVEGLRGCELTVQTGAGHIALHGLHGKLRVSSGAGKIAGDKLSGSFDVDTGMGAIRLGITSLDEGTHKFRSNVGAVDVDLAPGQRVRFETHAMLGGVHCDYPSTPDAPTVVQLGTDVGGVRVRERGARATEGGGFSAWAADIASDVMGGYRPRSDTERGASGRGPSVPDEELRRVLDMVEQGKISAKDAEMLLRAMERR